MADPTTQAPTLVAFERTSATVARVTWENHAVTGATYSQIRVYLRKLPSDPWPTSPTLTVTGSGIQLQRVDLTGLLAAEEYEVRLVAFGPAGVSPTSSTRSIDAWHEIPAIPTGLTLEYLGAGQLVKWTNHHTPTAPYGWIYIFRSDNMGPYVQINRLTVPATGIPQSQYYDGSAPGDTRVSYRVYVTNAAGGPRFHSAVTDPLWTRPVAPYAPRLRWVGSGLVADWDILPAGVTAWSADDPRSRVSTRWEVEYRTGASDWIPQGVVTSRSWSLASPAAGVQHQVRIVGTPPDGVRLSPAAVTAWLSPWQPPKAPLVGVSAGQDATGVVRVSWAHQPTDGTAQRAYEVEYRVGSGAYLTTGIAYSGNEFHDFPAATFSNGGDLDVRVRTVGQHTNAGPWSAPTIIRLRPKPSVSITSPLPAQVVHSRSLLISFTASAQLRSWAVTVLDDSGVVVWSRTSAEATGVPSQVQTPDILTDGEAYTVRVEADTANGAASPAEVGITVVLQRPAVPSLTVLVDPVSDTVQATVEAGSGGDVPTESLLLQRSWDGVDWESVAESVTGTVSDPIPPLNRTYWLSVRAVSADGGVRDSDPVAVTVESRRIWLHHGDGWGQSVAGGKRGFSGSDGRERVQHELADGSALTEESEVTLPTRLEVSPTLIEATGSSPLTAWRRALSAEGPHCYRDTSGLVLVGTLDSQHRWTADTIHWQPLSFAISGREL